MNKLLISAYMALLYGVGLGGFETLVNWGQWQWWPFWLVDYVAAALLLFGGFKTLKHPYYGAKLLCLGWGFALGMLWMSLAGNISNGTDPARAARVANLYIILIVFSMLLSFIGLILALKGNPKQETPIIS